MAAVPKDEILRAATAGDVASLSRLVADHGAVAARLDGEPEELTALHLAAAAGRLEAVEYLLSSAVGAAAWPTRPSVKGSRRRRGSWSRTPPNQAPRRPHPAVGGFAPSSVGSASRSAELGRSAVEAEGPVLSFVIPAHNEEQHIGPTVAAVFAAGRASGETFEVIVVDDASTDRTAEIAAACGARVIHVQHRQIAATRNAGARDARGDVLFFVDADTLANPDAVRACLRELSRGAVGGGCVFRFDGVLPIWARILYPVAVVLARQLELVGGCFLYCTREAFEAVGGFDERYFAAEEVAFIRALERRGRFAVPRPVVVTSGRKLRSYSGWRIVREAWRWATSGPESYQQRDGLDIWYGERAPDQVPAPNQALRPTVAPGGGHR